MPMLITGADERLNRRDQIKGVILGPSKIGKTSLLWTMDQESVLFINLEAGDLSIQGFTAPEVNVRQNAAQLGLHPWEFAQAWACLIGGPDPAKREDETYGARHYAWAVSVLGDPAVLFANIATLFVDSITVAGRHCFHWCQGQPDAKTAQGAYDGRGAYGLHAREMINWLTQIQHVEGKNVWFLGILDKVTDDYGRVSWQPQIEGSKVGREIAGIMDEVVCMVEHDFGTDHGKHRVFICTRPNPEDYPAGDRSRQLSMIEEPHLGKLMDKISAPKKAAQMQTALPARTGVAAANAAVVEAPPSAAQPQQVWQQPAGATQAEST